LIESESGLERSTAINPSHGNALKEKHLSGQTAIVTSKRKMKNFPPDGGCRLTLAKERF
jgi:hypothetical protein